MSNMNLLLKPTPSGERAFPFPQADLLEMLDRGEITQVSRNPVVYRVKPGGTIKVVEEDDEDTPEEPKPQVYVTRDMVAKPGMRRRR